MEQIKENGVEVIWPHIEEKITDDMFAEFGDLYSGRNHADFVGLVGSGIYTELKDLKQFQKQIQASLGYHQYCSKILSHSSLFFPSQARNTDFNLPEQSKEASNKIK